MKVSNLFKNMFENGRRYFTEGFSAATAGCYYESRSRSLSLYESRSTYIGKEDLWQRVVLTLLPSNVTEKNDVS